MRLALVLLISLTALYAVGQLSPDPSYNPGIGPGAKQFAPAGFETSFQASPLRRIYDSPVGIVLAGVLLTNLAVCTANRALKLLRRKTNLRSPEDLAYLGANGHPPLPTGRTRNDFVKELPFSLEDTIVRLQEVLASRRYEVYTRKSENAASIYGEKGKLSGWGSVVFHASILIIVAGAAYGELTSFKSVAVIAEGQTFTEKHEEYVLTREAPFFTEDRHQGFSLKLKRFTPVYQGWYPVDARSEVAVMEGDKVVREAVIRINNPLKYRGVSFLLDRDGFTPLFAIKNSDGKIIMANWVNLKIGRSSHEQDSFYLPGFDYRVTARIYPDFVMDGDRMTSISFLPNNPVLYLQLYSPAGELLAEGPLALNQSVQLGNFYLTFQDLRYWNSFRVVRNDGEFALIFGFILAVLGLAIRFLSIQKRVWVYVQGSSRGSMVYLRGKVSHFDELYVGEFEDISRELATKPEPEMVLEA